MRKIHEKSKACQEGSIKELFVARTIAKNERGLDKFARGIAWNLGVFDAEIKTVESMHLVVFGGISSIIAKRMTAKNLRDFSDGLEAEIHQQLGSDYSSVVKVDQSAPLMAIGDSRNKLALRIKPDENLRAQRRVVLTYAESQLGQIPQTEDITYAVELGRLSHRPLYKLRTNPEELLTYNGGLSVPSEISLNGLAVHMGRIHPREEHIRFNHH